MLNRPEELEFSPYVGPRSFERQDRDLFFGRDYETMEIISDILSNPITLIYSQSGVGKTSLINTKIIYELEKQYKFLTFPSARVRSSLPPDKIPRDINNIYMFNALQSLKPDADLEALKKETLCSFLKQNVSKSDKEDKTSPRVIVFDQLEELFGLYPENWYDQQQDFFRQIAEVLNEDNLLRMVLVIREEYLAQLSSFAHLIPGRLRTRFRLERLRKESALEAVIEPLRHTGRVIFAPGIAEKLVDDLLTMRVENIFGKIVDMKGEYVEPVYLQVVCQRLWMKVISSRITEITQEHLKGLADVNQALTGFYLDTISYASKQTHIKQDTIRNWFDQKLITSSGTRGIVHREDKSTGGLPNNVVDILQQRYLIRQEWRSGSRWYELTHDRLIGPIREYNKEWKQKKKVKKIIISTALIVSVFIGIMVFASLIFAPTPQQTLIVDRQTLIVDQRIVPVGRGPIAVAVNPSTNKIYVANYDQNTISVINGTTNNIIAAISVGDSPNDVAVNPSTNKIYVANYDENTVSVINGTTDNVIGVIPVGNSPIAVAVNPSTNKIYVANYDQNTISVMSSTAKNVIGDMTALIVDQRIVPVGIGPDGLGINPSTNTIYVANDGDNTISVINGKTDNVTGVIPVGGSPTGVVVNPSTNKIYVANYDEDTISVINGTANKVIGVIRVDESPTGVTVNPSTNKIYVANYDQNTISVINGTTNNIIAAISVGDSPNDVAVNPSTNKIYVVNQMDNTMSVITSVRNETTSSTTSELTAEELLNLRQA